MQISVTGHHIEITPSLNDYINDKFLRLKRHFDQIGIVHVVLNVEKLRQKAEASLQVSKGKFFAEAETEDMYSAIDSLVDKLDRQIKKQKGKNTDYHR